MGAGVREHGVGGGGGGRGDRAGGTVLHRAHDHGGGHEMLHVRLSCTELNGHTPMSTIELDSLNEVEDGAHGNSLAAVLHGGFAGRYVGETG